MKKDKEIEPIFTSPYFYHKTKSPKTPPLLTDGAYNWLYGALVND